MSMWDILAMFGLFVCGIIAWALVEGDKHFWGVTTVVLSVAAAFWWFSIDPVSIAKNHWQEALIYIGAYLAGGVVWAVIKWWFFLSNIREDFDEWVAKKKEEDAFHEKAKAAGRNVGEHNPWKSTDFSIGYNKSFPPLVREWKGKITGWMIMWPFSAVWTMINDPVRKFFNWTYRVLSGVLQSMNDRQFADIHNGK